jgi:hypothetical protein
MRAASGLVDGWCALNKDADSSLRSLKRDNIQSVLATPKKQIAFSIAIGAADPISQALEGADPGLASAFGKQLPYRLDRFVKKALDGPPALPTQWVSQHHGVSLSPNDGQAAARVFFEP